MSLTALGGEMPCYRCGVRQTDPVRGPSRWKRGVRRDAQVLICPQCQENPDWTRELDGCRTCGSTLLACRLGEVECRECGLVRRAQPQERREIPATQPASLPQEVADAIHRILGAPGER